MRRPDRRGAWGSAGLASAPRGVRRPAAVAARALVCALVCARAAAGGNARANGAGRRRGAHAPGRGFPGFAYRIEASRRRVTVRTVSAHRMSTVRSRAVGISGCVTGAVKGAVMRDSSRVTADMIFDMISPTS